MKRLKKFGSIMLVLLLTLMTISQYYTADVFADEEYIPIYTADDLYNINYGLDKNYILMNDIDLTEETTGDGAYNIGGNGWKPIEGEFTGIFDGNNHSINGLQMNYTYTLEKVNNITSVGLFSFNNGIIKNLLVEGKINYTLDCSAPEIKIGSIVATNKGEILNCISKCNITGNFIAGNMVNNPIYIGGITGAPSDSKSGVVFGCSNYGKIKYSTKMYNNYYCKVFAGGITGSGTPTKCYNVASLEANNVKIIKDYVQTIAGISGISFSSTGLVDCYNTGDISANANAYGIAYSRNNDNAKCIIARAYNSGSINMGGEGKGYPIAWTWRNNSFTTVTNSYFLEGSGLSDVGGTSLTEAGMLKQSLYLGFDFDNVWILSSDSYYKYPQIRGNRQDDKVEKIELKSAPTKTNYKVGEEIDLSGSALKVTYLEGVSADVQITSDMISGYNKSKAGDYVVEVTYKGKTTSFGVKYTSSGGGTGDDSGSGSSSGDYSGGSSSAGGEDDTSYDFGATSYALDTNRNIVKADVKVDATQIKTDKATIKVTTDSDISLKEIDTLIPKELSKAVVSNGTKLEVSTPIATITFDTKALSKFQDEDVTLCISTKNNKININKVTQIDYSVTLRKGNKVISKFDGGKVRVALPIPKGISPKSNAKVLYNFGKYVTDMNGTIEGNKIVFETNHFSKYSVMKKTAANKKLAKSIKSSTIKSLRLTSKAGKITLTWKKGKGNTPTKYQIYRSLKKTKGFIKLGTVKTASMMYSDAKRLKKGTTYYYKVVGAVKVGSKWYNTKPSPVRSIKYK